MWLSVLALAVLCEAHVRLIHKPSFSLPIRNAATVSSDGTLSTAGPCGGVLNWGNKTYSNVTVGQNLTLVFAYNGGHQSGTLNMLRVAMICGKPMTDILLRNTTVAPVSCPEVNASQSLTSGYNLWVVIPPLQSGMNGHLCTISVLDKRNWGGCVDVQVLAAGSGGTPSTQNALVGKSIAGEYTFGQPQCEIDSPGCCCVNGTLSVVHVTGATTATGTVKLSSCVYANSTVRGLVDTVLPFQLVQQASTLASLKATVAVGANTLSFQVSAGTTNTLLMTDDSATPAYCGFNSPLFAGPKQTSPTPGTDASASARTVAGISAVILAALFSH